MADSRFSWKRFSLRTLFLLMTLCCVVIGTWSAYVNPYRRQVQSLNEVKRLGGQYETRAADGPAWHRWLVTTYLGADAFVHVTKVNLAVRNAQSTHNVNFENPQYLQLQQMLNALQMRQSEIASRDRGNSRTAEIANQIAQVQQQIDANVANQLAQAQPSIDDAALQSLAGLGFLEELQLDYTPITDVGVAALRPLRELRRLSMRYVNITDRAAEHLAFLPKLETVYLTGAKLTDAAIDDLARHPAMKEMYLRWSRITNDGAARLRAALPNCAVHYHALIVDSPKATAAAESQ